MRIDVYADTICPWCFIGKRRLERALAARIDLAVEVRWRPFQLNPEMPRQGIDRDTYLGLKFGGIARAQQLYAMIADAGHSERLAFRFDAVTRTPNTLDSHRLVRFAAARGGDADMAEALFRAYFLDGVDIGDIEALIRIAVTGGYDGAEVRRYLASDEACNEVTAEDLRARRMGIEGVPCFIVNDRYAVAGAQDPEAFFPLLDIAVLEAAGELAADLPSLA